MEFTQLLLRIGQSESRSEATDKKVLRRYIHAIKVVID